MNKSELLKGISRTLIKADVDKLAALSSGLNYSMQDLLDLTFYPKKEIAFRAAWVLECIVLADPQRFLPHIAEFLDRYPRQTNPRCQRHFSKILMLLTAQKRGKGLGLPDHYNMEPLVEKTFEWLIDPESPIAVQVNCIEALFNLRNQFSWITEELRAEILYLLKNGRAAMQSRGKAILKKLDQ